MCAAIRANAGNPGEVIEEPQDVSMEINMFPLCESFVLYCECAELASIEALPITMQGP